MANFVTRVELHGGTATDYEKLHESMKRHGFSRQIVGSDGKFYHLPTAEYFLQSNNLDVVQVRDKARTASMTIGKGFSVLTTQGDSAWIGLVESK